MELKSCELIPAVILDVEDPKKLGRIKCQIPNMCDNSVMKPSRMPWVLPMCMGGNQTFSKMTKGSKVWVLKNNTNYNELWYLPFHETTNDTKQYLSDNFGNSPDVLYMRNNMGKTVSITCDSSNGYEVKTGDWYMQIKNDGDIIINGNNANVLLRGGKAYLGSGIDSEYVPAVRAPELKKVLNDLATALQQLASDANSPYTMNLVPGFNAAADTLSDANLSTFVADSAHIN